MDRIQHVKLVAWLYILGGALILLSAVGAVIGVLVGGVASGHIVEILVSPIVAVVVLIVVGLFALPCFLAGKGLLEGKGWARVLAMVLGAFSFFNFPLGTALCVYTFWTLWGDAADAWFEPGYAGYTEDI